MAQDPNTATTDATDTTDAKEDTATKTDAKTKGKWQMRLTTLLNDAKQKTNELIDDAKEKSQDLVNKLEQINKESSDVSILMQKALAALTSYEKTLTKVEDDTKGKIEIFNQFAKAKGVVYIHSWKLGVGLVGGGYGRGILIADTDAGWSLPLAIEQPTFKFGPQLQATAGDHIILVKNEKQMKAFMNSDDKNKIPSLTIGADAFVAWGQSGKGVTADVTANDTSIKQSGVSGVATSLSATDQKGIGGGATVDIATFLDFKDANKLFYGENYSRKEILQTSPNMSDNEIVKKLGDKLKTTKDFITILEGFIVDEQDRKAVSYQDADNDPNKKE